RDVVLPELALGLVDRHRGPSPEVRARELGIDLALVERVSVLVQRAEQRLDVALAVARRHARVAGSDPRREWVRRGVDAPSRLVDPEYAQDRCDGRALDVDRGRELDARAARARLFEQWRQLSRQRSEDPRKLGGAKPEVVIAEQTLVRALAVARDELAVRAR